MRYSADEVARLPEEKRAACRSIYYIEGDPDLVSDDDPQKLYEEAPGRVLALDAETGETLWSRNVNGRKMIVTEAGIAVSTGRGVVSLRPKR
ncbi:MAG: hypothetical protein R3F11_32040 [Verrucomicrobiales bacterium]